MTVFPQRTLLIEMVRESLYCTQILDPNLPHTYRINRQTCSVINVNGYKFIVCLLDISDIHSVASDHSNRSHDRKRSSRSRSPDRRSEPSDHSRHSPPQISNGRSDMLCFSTFNVWSRLNEILSKWIFTKWTLRCLKNGFGLWLTETKLNGIVRCQNIPTFPIGFASPVFFCTWFFFHFSLSFTKKSCF